MIILSGPSGCGKSTVVRRLLAEPPAPVRLSVSATTRAPRADEQDGVQYHFWTRARFEQAIQSGEFLEWAEVYGHYYGTPVSEVEPYRRQGITVLLEIDVQGAAQVCRKCPDAVTVFLRTSSIDTYRQRLEGRGSEDPASLERRVAAAQRELAHAETYQYQIINDDLESAVAAFRDIVRRHSERGNHAG
ncbi:MAG: guanylate kinase [Gemmataceae bacterium]